MTELMIEIHAKSNLTWEQIAMMMRCSRRSAYGWLTRPGGRSYNRERAEKILALIKKLNRSPKETRAAILEGSPSLLDLYYKGMEDGCHVPQR